MPKVRAELSAVELEELYRFVERKLQSTGVLTQPKVAQRILELVQQPDVTVTDFADVIRTDWTTAGRILKLANSAYFAQRTPVTALERALVLLGLDRVKSIALGVYLSRGAASAGAQAELSRRVWGESVYRACLAARLASARGSGLVSEAFVIGLMLDCGVPLMSRVVGDGYEQLVARCRTPGELYTAELTTLPCTHVDVATVLMRQWRIPPTLAKPIGWHHAAAPGLESSDPAGVLRRIACSVGSVAPRELAEAEEPTDFSDEHTRAMGLDREQVGEAVGEAAREYSALMQLFGDVADPVPRLEELAQHIHAQLLTAFDAAMLGSMLGEDGQLTGVRLRLGRSEVLLERRAPGKVNAFVTGADGSNELRHVLGGLETPESLRRMLCLDDASDQDLRRLEEMVRRMLSGGVKAAA